MRSINLIKDIYTAPDKSNSKESPFVVQFNLDAPIMSVSPNMPGRVFFADVTFNGFKDMLVTLKYTNGSSVPQILYNSPCDLDSCSPKAKITKRRTFKTNFEQFDKSDIQNLIKDKLEKDLQI